eukprot:CAMPEP_0198266960 /NCGR_PEP_ID=MMETSP1447-20131203/30898_1 /TAXON_ID=420782 /ORGANISM="Chaetoceros dichaeta, Strain CCMP1751" /LENGTH=547 /DNA_ID=CAMNT_0043957295 /DNA_START=109 /DNA_END=1748 /DNA_ORIENTATION=-
MSGLSLTNLSLDLISRPAGIKSKAKLRYVIFSLFLCAVTNRVVALSTQYGTTPRSIGYRIPTVPTDVPVGFPQIGHQRIGVCLRATKEKLKDETTDGNGNRGDPRVYDPVSQITVERAEEDDSSAENCAGDDIILQRKIQYEGDEDGKEEEEEETIAKRRAAIRLAIDRNNKKPSRSRNFTERKTGRNKTSVGPKRIGSASRARKAAGGTRAGIPAKILSGLQTTAGAAVHKKNISSSAPRKEEDLAKFQVDEGEIRSDGDLQSNGRGLTAAIRSTVEGLLQKQIEIRSKAGHGNTLLKVESIPDVKPKTLLTKSDFTKKNHIRKSSENSQPGTALVSGIMSFPDLISNQICVKLALPFDDIAIANLRLSVFSDFSEDLRRQFCQRSCEVLNRRRQNGASCLVARGCSPLNRADIEVIVGSVECSTHEFIHTELGRRRPGGTIMYITEVAVSPDSRRNGVGTLLLKAVDQLAKLKEMETIYLHVDVENAAACELYKKAGYKILDSTNHIYAEFTTVLNLHDGATKGRKHYLLHKIMTENQTWLPPFG